MLGRESNAIAFGQELESELTKCIVAVSGIDSGVISTTADLMQRPHICETSCQPLVTPSQGAQSGRYSH